VWETATDGDKFVITNALQLLVVASSKVAALGKG